MITSRAGLMALRRVAKPSALFPHNATAAAALVVVPSPTLHLRRAAATQAMSHDEAQAQLAAQRRARPVSPHLEIYDKHQTWFGSSIFQRFTGMFFSGALYAYSVGYLVAPLAGWHLESLSVAAAFGAWPLVAKGAVKTALAWPFVFHALNGVKHLVHDATAKGFKKNIIKRNEYAIWGTSTVVALGLAFLL